MSDDGPYRQAQGIQCPQCATVLLASANGDLTCPLGCGEWIPRGLAAERWGDAVTIDGDARLKWRVGRSAVACPVCKEQMARQVHPGWQSQRCPDHGVWFVGNARGLFEHQLAADIARHEEEQQRERARRQVVEAIATLIQRAGRGDHAAIKEIVDRIVTLEQRVAELAAAVEALARAPR
jgi:hypothetical protein